MKLLLNNFYVLVLVARSSGNSREPCRDPGSRVARVKPEGRCHRCPTPQSMWGINEYYNLPRAESAPLGRHSRKGGSCFGFCFALLELDGVGNSCGEVATTQA